MPRTASFTQASKPLRHEKSMLTIVKVRIQDPQSIAQRKKNIQPAYARSEEVPLLRIMELWLDKIKISAKQSTFSTYSTIVYAHLAPELGNIPARGISCEVISCFISSKLDSGRTDGKGGLSPASVRSIVSVLRSVLDYGEREGYLRNAAGAVTQPRALRSQARILSEAEQSKLEACIYRDTDLVKLGILVCLYTGIRLGEICALKWESISFDEGTISISKTIQRIKNSDTACSGKTKIIFDEPKSYSSVRTIPAPPFLLKVLKEHKKENKCFLLTGKPNCFIEPRTYQNHFKLILKEAGIDDINFHALRHTFATKCVNLGFDIKTLSEILGHSNASVTLNTYVHPSFDTMKLCMKKLSPDI